MRSCCCNAASGLASPGADADAARRVRGDVTTAPNVGAGLAGRDEDPVPPPPLPAPAPLAEANRPAASEVHDAGVAARDDDDEGEGEDGACTCTWESSCTARLSAATSCSRSSRLRTNRLCARDRRVAGAFDECAHGALHVLRFGIAGDRARHGEQRRVPARDAFLIRDTYLELDARVFAKVVQARKDRL